MTASPTAPSTELIVTGRSTRRRHAGPRPRGRILLTVVLAVVALIWLVPLVGVLVTSMRSKAGAAASGWWTVFFDWGHADWSPKSYADAFEALQLPDGLFNSLAVTVPATVLPIVFASMTAYVFTFLRFRGKEAIFALILALLVIPQQIAFIPIIQLFVWVKDVTGIQVIGQYPAAWIIHSAFALPLAIYIFRNYMATLPVSLIEAARVDGARHFQIFLRVVAPMSVPVIAAFAIFQFLWVWNDFLIEFIFIGSGPNAVLTQGLYDLLGQYGQGWQRVSAGSIITVIVPLVIFFALQRYFVRGLIAGAVK